MLLDKNQRAYMTSRASDVQSHYLFTFDTFSLQAGHFTHVTKWEINLMRVKTKQHTGAASFLPKELFVV